MKFLFPVIAFCMYGYAHIWEYIFIIIMLVQINCFNVQAHKNDGHIFNASIYFSEQQMVVDSMKKNKELKLQLDNEKNKSITSEKQYKERIEYQVSETLQLKVLEYLNVKKMNTNKLARK